MRNAGGAARHVTHVRMRNARGAARRVMRARIRNGRELESDERDAHLAVKRARYSSLTARMTGPLDLVTCTPWPGCSAAIHGSFIRNYPRLHRRKPGPLRAFQPRSEERRVGKE